MDPNYKGVGSPDRGHPASFPLLAPSGPVEKTGFLTQVFILFNTFDFDVKDLLKRASEYCPYSLRHVCSEQATPG